MATSPLALTDSMHEGRRPSRIDAPPAKGEIKKLRDRLLTYGRDDGRALTEQACQFISEHVVAPAAVRAQLNRPSVRPTATGQLEVVHATVLVDALIPDPGNGRVVGATAWPAADQSAGQTLKLWAPSDLHVHPDSSCEVLVQADTVTEFKTLLEEAAEKTKQLNPKMKSKIERDGILDPLLCQLMHVRTADGFSGVALVTRDGSTRCSFAKQAHRSLPYDSLFGAVRDLDARRQRWLEMKRHYEGPAHELSLEEVIQLRTFLVDVQIVVGFVTHDSGLTVLDAVDDIVRRTHVETSLPWLQVAQDNSQADLVLAALHKHDVITSDEFLLYGGKLSRDQRVAAGFPVEPDCVLATLLKTFGATATASANDSLHKVMRSVTHGGQVRDIYKAGWAGSLALRQFDVDGRSLQSANNTLGEALRVEAIWDEPWSNTKRSPAELRDVALGELDADGEPGPAARELLVKAAGHLAAQGWMKPQISGGRGLERDQRQPNVLLDSMHMTRQGIHTLAEALAAGRRGADARAMDEDGQVIEQGGGDAMPLSNEWIRKAFLDTGVAEPTFADDGFLAPQTAHERVAGYLRKAEASTSALKQALDRAAGEKDDNDMPFLERHGWSRGETDPLAEQLRATAHQLERYGLTAELAQSLPPLDSTTPPEQASLEELLEGRAA
jgi:hypothetical protein